MFFEGKLKINFKSLILHKHHISSFVQKYIYIVTRKSKYIYAVEYVNSLTTIIWELSASTFIINYDGEKKMTPILNQNRPILC